jgi:hypothetical protein
MQRFGHNATQLFTLAQNISESFIKVDTFINSIDISDNIGKEIVTTFKTSLEDGG